MMWFSDTVTLTLGMVVYFFFCRKSTELPYYDAVMKGYEDWVRGQTVPEGLLEKYPFQAEKNESQTVQQWYSALPEGGRALANRFFGSEGLAEYKANCYAVRCPVVRYGIRWWPICVVETVGLL